MRRDNKMMLAVTVLSALAAFLFAHDAEQKVSAGGICLVAVLAVGWQGCAAFGKRSRQDRRLGRLCGGMGLFTVLLIWFAGKCKGDMEAYGRLLTLEGWLLMAVILVWWALCIWAEKGVTDDTVLLILFGAFLIRVFYAVMVQSHILQNDLGAPLPGSYGHMGYVYYLYSEGRLPEIYLDQFYHPPLHHAVFAILMKAFVALGYGTEPVQELLQLVSVAYGTLTLFFLNKIGIRLKISPLGRGIGLAFASFLPCGIMMGSALNNDSLMVLLAVMALYYTLVWYDKSDYGNIVIMALCIGGSMMTKLSGALAAPAMAVLMLHRAWKGRAQWRKWIGQFVCFAVISFPLGLWYSVYRYVCNGMPFGYVPLLEGSEQWIGQYTGWSRILDFENAFESLALRWSNSEWIDHNIFVSMIKFAVLGEGYDYRINPALHSAATGIFWATFALALLAAAGYIIWLFQRKHTIAEKVFLSVVFVTVFGSYFQFCLSYPLVCTMNIRYVILGVYLLLLVFGEAVSILTEKAGRKSAAAGRAVGAVCLCTVGCYMAGAAVLIVQASQVLP